MMQSVSRTRDRSGSAVILEFPGGSEFGREIFRNRRGFGYSGND